MYTLKAKASFDAAHFLQGHGGKCKNLHGHRWEVLAEVSGADLEAEGKSRGMLIDFADFKKALRNLAEEFDHMTIIEEGSMRESTLLALKEEGFTIISLPFRPTAEHLAKYFYDKMLAMGMPMKAMTIYETPDNCASYEGETC